MPRFFLLVCSFPRPLFPSSVQLLLNHNKTAPQPFPQPSNNHVPTTTQPQPNKAKWTRQICRAFVRPIVLLPSIRQKTPRPRYNRPCPVHRSSLLPTTTQPRQKCSTTISHPFNNHVPTTSQPSFGSNTRTTRFRLNRPTSLIRQLQPLLINNSTSTTPRPRHNRPYPVLIKPFISPSNLNHQFNLDHQTKRRARPEDRALRFSHNRVIGTHTIMRTGRRTSPNGELPPRRWSR